MSDVFIKPPHDRGRHRERIVKSYPPNDADWTAPSKYAETIASFEPTPTSEQAIENHHEYFTSPNAASRFAWVRRTYTHKFSILLPCCLEGDYTFRRNALKRAQNRTARACTAHRPARHKLATVPSRFGRKPLNRRHNRSAIDNGGRRGAISRSALPERHACAGLARLRPRPRVFSLSICVNEEFYALPRRATFALDTQEAAFLAARRVSIKT